MADNPGRFYPLAEKLDGERMTLKQRRSIGRSVASVGRWASSSVAVC